MLILRERFKEFRVKLRDRSRIANLVKKYIIFSSKSRVKWLEIIQQILFTTIIKKNNQKSYKFNRSWAFPRAQSQMIIKYSRDLHIMWL